MVSRNEDREKRREQAEREKSEGPIDREPADRREPERGDSRTGKSNLLPTTLTLNLSIPLGFLGCRSLT